MKIVLAFDSFKGSLTAAEACAAACEGLLSVHNDVEVISLPVGDGGEGTCDALVKSSGGSYAECKVTGPLCEEVTARYGILPDGSVVMDMAAASGLTLVPSEKRNPWKTTSFGTGEMILDALGRGARRLIIGLGGSATVDGGMGMLRALGVKFYDADNLQLDGCGANLERVERVDFSSMDPRLADCRIDVAVDTSAPLYGPTGAAYVFAPQKGADAEMTRRLDEGLRKYGAILNAASGRCVTDIPGAGAAGGLGAALLALPHSAIRVGIDIVLDAVGFDKIAADADLVMTGEGKMDSQTLTGKAPMGILRRCKRLGIPVVGVSGSVNDDDALLAAGFSSVTSITPPDMSLAEALLPEVASHNISEAVLIIFKNFA